MDAAEQSVRQAENSGAVVDELEETASGAKIEAEDPYPTDPGFTGADTDGEYPHLGTVGKPITGCALNGVPLTDCTWIFQRLRPMEMMEWNARSEFLYYSALVDGRSVGAYPDMQTAIAGADALGSSALIRNWRVNDNWFQGSVSSLQAQSQNPQNTNPENTNPAFLQSHVDNVCSLLVEFSGPGFTEPNGPGESRVGASVYGLGFTVSGSVVHGAIGTVETADGIDTINANGNWAIQQWESDSSRATYDGVPGRLFYGGIATHPDGPRRAYRAVENQSFVYSDFPGPFKHTAAGNLTYMEAEYDFDIKLISGSQQCEVKFHVSMSFRHGKFSANWRGR